MSTHRIFGAEVSPYSVKVRSAFRYKGVPHTWIERGMAQMETFQKYARLPLIPLVVKPDEGALQDSTPILEYLETLAPAPSFHPTDPAAAFLSALLEEFGDEWGNKWMFHYRWWREADQQSAASRIARIMLGPDAPDDAVDSAAQGLVKRMVPRLSFVGSNEKTAGIIEASFERGAARLEAHLAERPYLFGARPAFADFGLWGQIYNAATDPTAGAHLRETAPRLLAWVERMHRPSNDGPFESWDALAPTLEPFLAEEVGARFLPWSDANARALAAGEKAFSVELAGEAYAQETQKYHARSLAALRQRYTAVSDRSALDPVLERTGCLTWLQS